MPGLGASPDIFKGLKISDAYQVKHLHWMMPQPNESLTKYVQRLIATQMASEDQQPVLLGMSFGGMIINEISRQIPVKALIFISTAKSKKELPPRITLGRWLQIYNWFPFGIFENPKKIKKYLPVKHWQKRMDLYDRYLEIKTPYYLSWSVEKVLKWQGDLLKIPFIHIHGDQDLMFPVKYIQEPVEVINGATHMAILTHKKQISRWIVPFLNGL